MRVAAIDCGTNSLRLLVTDLDPATGASVEVERRSTIVRLGQGVDRTGVFAAEALQRTFATLGDYAAVVASLDVADVRMVATSAARDAANREVFLTGAQDRVGVPADIVSGDEEARLSYDGATRSLDAADGLAAPLLVLDIGGGSTEFVMRPDAEADVLGRSLDIGSVRLAERHLRDDPPSHRQVDAAVADVEAALDRLDLPLAQVKTLVGVAGTTLTMAAMVLDLPAYDRDAVHLTRIDARMLLRAVDDIVAMSVTERLALAFMHPDRADVIGAGALVLGSVVRRLGIDTLVPSSHDILDGIAWSLVDEQSR
ncbi:MAG: exopolyphosphatase [Nocardioidaceae bacterium]|nr:exopolyphosphatase [Nocardioidaceae bacterium]